MTTAVSFLPLPIVGERVAIEASETLNRASLRRLTDNLVVGYAAFVPERSTLLHIASLQVDEAHRGYGVGSEAARLIVDAAFAAGFSRVTAWAPPARGLATYFWYRMGMRALHGEGPNGGLLFERTGSMQDVAQDGGTIGSQ